MDEKNIPTAKLDEAAIISKLDKHAVLLLLKLLVIQSRSVFKFFDTGRLVLKKTVLLRGRVYAEYGFDQQRLIWYMFVACGIWCLVDVSSVSPSSEQTAAPQATNIPYQPLLIKPIFTFFASLRCLSHSPISLCFLMCFCSRYAFSAVQVLLLTAKETFRFGYSV